MMCVSLEAQFSGSIDGTWLSPPAVVWTGSRSVECWEGRR